MRDDYRQHPRERTGVRTFDARLGISLYTLLAAVVVLGVLTSVLVTSFSGTHTKGQALWALVNNLGQAANRFHLDTSCYPRNIDALWSQTWANKRNSCGDADLSQWHGPYINKMSTISDNAVIHQFGPDAIVRLNYGATDHYAVVRARNINSAIVDDAFDACGGEDSLCRVVDNGSTEDLIYFYSGAVDEDGYDDYN